MENVIISSVSPLTGLVAEVIDENDCSYLYLYQPEVVNEQITEKSLKTFSTCWIKNHVIVSDTYSPKDDMQKGLQPRVPTKFCNSKEDITRLEKGQLEIVWGEEGSIVSLFENEELLCVIPYWADLNFVGYSKFSNTSEIPMIPFPLGDANSNALFERSENAKAFWKQNFNNVWNDYQKGYFSELENRYGEHIKYYRIDGGKFPPKGLAIFEKGDVRYAFTIGIGIFPQPKVDMYMKDYHDYERFELGFCYHAVDNVDEMRIFSQISSIASIPWVFNTFLDNYHTVDLQIDDVYKNAVLVADRNIKLAQFEFLREHKVNLLWILPIMDNIYVKLTAEKSDYSDIEIRIANKDISFLPYAIAMNLKR